ncbi:MAG: hypothetical protein ACI38A_07990 [Candidatus Ornithomonoglobus sp.]
MKYTIKIISTCACIMVIGILISTYINYKDVLKLPEYYKSAVPDYKSELMHRGTRKERGDVKEIFEEFNQALASVEPDKETAEKKHGILARYAVIAENNYAAADPSEIKSTSKLLSAHCDNDTGYIWVIYSRDISDINGQHLCGCANCYIRFGIEKDNDHWEIADIAEAP